MRSSLFGALSVAGWAILSTIFTAIILAIGLMLPLPDCFRTSSLYAISPLAISAVAEEFARFLLASILNRLRCNIMITVASLGLGVAIIEFIGRASPGGLSHQITDYAPAASLHIFSATIVVVGIMAGRPVPAFIFSIFIHVAFNTLLARMLTTSHTSGHHVAHAIIGLVLILCAALILQKRALFLGHPLGREGQK